MSETKTAETTANQTEVEQPKEPRAFFQMIDEGDGVRFIIDTNGAELIRAFTMLFVEKPDFISITKFAIKEALLFKGTKRLDEMMEDINRELKSSKESEENDDVDVKAE